MIGRWWYFAASLVAATSIVARLDAEPGVVEPAASEEATPEQRQQVDALFAPWNRTDSPGAAVAVVRAGRVVLARGYGSAQLEHGAPIAPETVFHVASVSKQFTTFAVALLAQDGKLSWDDDVRRHRPELHDFGHTVTLRHLAHHTSGLRDQWELLAIAGWRLDDVITRDHILRLVRRQRELNFVPGAEHLYSNTGFTLLAEVVARVSGMPFERFCAERIFAPLAMTRTHFHVDHEQVVPGRADSYTRVAPPGSGFKRSVLSFSNAGATSLFTTVLDLARWLDNLDTGALGGEAVRTAMHQRGRLNDGREIDYALGVVHGTYRGLATVSHGGSDAGYRSVVIRFPAQRLGVVVLSNLADSSPGEMAGKVAAVFLDRTMEAIADAAPAAPPRLDAAALDRLAGSYALDSGPLVVIARRGLALVAEVQGFGEFELAPETSERFRLPALGSIVTFDGGATPSPGFTALFDGQPQRARRIERVAADLDQLVGDYVAPELGTLYTIARQGDGLVARHLRLGDLPLQVVASDRLQGGTWWLSALRFERDGNGAATGFRLSGGRVRNLRFVRVADPTAALLSARDDAPAGF